MSQQQQNLGGGGPGQLSFPGRACTPSNVQQCQSSMRGAGGRPPSLGADSSLEHLQAPTPKSDCLCQPGSSHILPPGLSGKPWY